MKPVALAAKRKRHWPFVALLLAVVLLAGCAPSPASGGASSLPGPVSSSSSAAASSAPANPPIPSATGGLYRIPLHDTSDWDAVPRYVVVNANGDEIYRGGDVELLHDLLTNQPYAFTAKRGKKTGEANEYGYAPYQIYSQLYDAGGTLLADWAPGVYRAVVDGWVIAASDDFMRIEIGQVGSSPDGYYCELRDMRTGEVKLADVGSISTKPDGGFIAYGSDGYAAGILDENLNAVFGFPLPAQYLNLTPLNGAYAAIVAPPGGKDGWQDGDISQDALLLDSAFSPRTQSGSYSYMYTVHGTYDFVFAEPHPTPMAMKQPGAACLLRAADGEVVYSGAPGDSISYCDGRVILTGGWNNDIYVSRMLDMQGQVLTGEYSLMDAMPQKDGEPAGTFYAYADGSLSILGPGGTVINSVQCGEVDHITYASALDELILYRYDDGTETSIAWVLNGDLETVVQPGYYTDISPSYNAPALLVASRRLNYNVTDVLGANGQVLAQDSRNVYIDSAGGIVAHKGFEVGLMDLNGNWRWKASAFSTLED